MKNTFIRILTLLFLFIAIAGYANAVVINEFESNPAGTDAGNEWVELYNDGALIPDLTGWTLEGNSNSIALSGALDTGEFLIFTFTSLSLNNDDAKVVLKNSTSAVIDEVQTTWDLDDNSDSNCWQRVPNGQDTDTGKYDSITGDWRILTCTKNSINEVAPTIDFFTPISLTPPVNEGATLQFSVTATDTNNDTLTYEWTLDNNVQTPTTNTYTYQPDYSASGPHEMKVTVSDGILTTTQIWAVTVDNVQLPALDLIELPGTVSIQEDSQTNVSFKVKNTGTDMIPSIDLSQTNQDLKDSDNHEITVTLEPTSVTNLNVNQAITIDATIVVPDKMAIGTYTTKITANETTATDSFILTINVGPSLCKDGVVGKLEITDVDVDSEYDVGDTIEITASVENNYQTENIDDVYLEAFLYDITKNKKLRSVKSDKVDIESDEDEEFTLKLDIPTDVKANDEFAIFLKAYENKNEDENCITSQEEITIARKDNDVAIDSVRIPTTVYPGDSIEIEIAVLNIGDEDQDDVIVEIFNKALNIYEISERFDLEKFGDDDDKTVSFDVKIPKSAEADDYTIEIRVKDADNDVYESGESFDEKITVLEDTSAEGSALTLDVQPLLSVEYSAQTTLPITIKNDNTARDITLELSGVVTQMQSLSLDAGETKTITVIIPPVDGYIVIKALSDGETLITKTTKVEVKQYTPTGSTVYEPISNLIDKETITIAFYGIGSVALVIILLHYLRALLFRKH